MSTSVVGHALCNRSRSPRSCQILSGEELQPVANNAPTPRLARTKSLGDSQSQSPRLHTHTHPYQNLRQKSHSSYRHYISPSSHHRLNRQTGVRHGKIRPQRTVHTVHATDDQASEAAIRAAYGRRIASFIVERRFFIACRTGIQSHHPKSTACATSPWPLPP
jgi:hypothetical protein